MNAKRITYNRSCTAMRIDMKLVFISIVLLALTMLSGCRYSDTLLETIIDPDRGVLEARANPEYMEMEGAPENPDLASIRLSENENYADQANFLPVYKEDASANGQAVRRTYSDETPNATDAVEGNQQDTSEQNNTSVSKNTQQTESNAASNEGDATDEQTSDQGDGTKADKTAGRGGTGQVYGEGSYEELPDARAVAAKGQYALIAQMLGGKGALAGADQAWIEKTRDSGAFPGEGVDTLVAFWDANGTLNVDALIASSADAILVDGVDVVLTDEQRSRLTTAGVNVVSVPVLGKTYTADKDIVTAVKVVGQILSGLNSQSQFKTAEMSENYIRFHDDVINWCVNTNGGYSYKMVAGSTIKGIYRGSGVTGEDTTNLSDNRITTACIDSWASTSGNSITANRSFGFQEDMYLHNLPIDISDGIGLSATTVGNNFVLSDYYLQTVGIVNNAYDKSKPVTSISNNDASYPYAVIAGSPDGMTPHQLNSPEIPSALWYSQIGIGPFDHWITVGDVEFPGIIVRDETIAKNVERSAGRANGLYNVGQSYKIYVMPSGLAGSWFDGNPESFLMSLWAFDTFYNSSNSQKSIEGFYKAFYRISDNATSQLEGYNKTLTATCPKG